jgi:hypothetical protein
VEALTTKNQWMLILEEKAAQTVERIKTAFIACARHSSSVLAQRAPKDA